MLTSTKSQPGSSSLGFDLSLAGGERDLALGQFRQAAFLEDKGGLGDVGAFDLDFPANRLARLIDALGIVRGDKEFLADGNGREHEADRNGEQRAGDTQGHVWVLLVQARGLNVRLTCVRKRRL